MADSSNRAPVLYSVLFSALALPLVLVQLREVILLWEEPRHRLLRFWAIATALCVVAHGALDLARAIQVLALPFPTPSLPLLTAMMALGTLLVLQLQLSILYRLYLQWQAARSSKSPARTLQILFSVSLLLPLALVGVTGALVAQLTKVSNLVDLSSERHPDQLFLTLAKVRLVVELASFLLPLCILLVLLQRSKSITLSSPARLDDSLGSQPETLHATEHNGDRGCVALRYGGGMLLWGAISIGTLPDSHGGNAMWILSFILASHSMAASTLLLGLAAPRRMIGIPSFLGCYCHQKVAPIALSLVHADMSSPPSPQPLTPCSMDTLFERSSAITCVDVVDPPSFPVARSFPSPPAALSLKAMLEASEASRRPSTASTGPSFYCRGLGSEHATDPSTAEQEVTNRLQAFNCPGGNGKVQSKTLSTPPPPRVPPSPPSRRPVSALVGPS